MAADRTISFSVGNEGELMQRRVKFLSATVAFVLSSLAPQPGRAAGHPGAPSVIAPSPEAGVPSAGRGKWRKRWIASGVALAALNLLDVHSSLGRGEANPLFRNSSGHFATGKAVAIKSAITGGFFASQLLLVRAHPEKNY